MITLRKNPFSDTSNEVEFVAGEKADELLARTLKENNYESALHYLRNNTPSHTNNSVILLVGDPHHKLHDEIKGEKIISLE